MNVYSYNAELFLDMYIYIYNIILYDMYQHLLLLCMYVFAHLSGSLFLCILFHTGLTDTPRLPVLQRPAITISWPISSVSRVCLLKELMEKNRYYNNYMNHYHSCIDLG